MPWNLRLQTDFSRLQTDFSRLQTDFKLTSHDLKWGVNFDDSKLKKKASLRLAFFSGQDEFLSLTYIPLLYTSVARAQRYLNPHMTKIAQYTTMERITIKAIPKANSITNLINERR